jgi:hypothetical protein
VVNRGAAYADGKVIINTNNAEVAIGGLVDGRAESACVVEFGHAMVADHSAAQRRAPLPGFPNA